MRWLRRPRSATSVLKECLENRITMASNRLLLLPSDRRRNASDSPFAVYAGGLMGGVVGLIG